MAIEVLVFIAYLINGILEYALIIKIFILWAGFTTPLEVKCYDKYIIENNLEHTKNFNEKMQKLFKQILRRKKHCKVVALWSVALNGQKVSKFKKAYKMEKKKELIEKYPDKSKWLATSNSCKCLC